MYGDGRLSYRRSKLIIIMLYAFKTWLEQWEYGEGTVRSRYTNCERIEAELGINLDDEFQVDEMCRLLELFKYSNNDFEQGVPPRHGMHIDGNVYNGTATLRSALNLYYSFKMHPEINPRTRMAECHANCGASNTLDGHSVCERAAQILNIDFAKLIAATALWAPVSEHNARNGGPDKRCRRAQTTRGEKVGDVVDGIRLDDNTAPNSQMKRVMKKHYGITPVNYTTCHIWDKTCYDERYHTCFANLVLIPSDIYVLSDFNNHVQKVLQYRAFEIFGWYPEEQEEPKKPDNYPTEWFSPNSEQKH